MKPMSCRSSWKPYKETALNRRKLFEIFLFKFLIFNFFVPVSSSRRQTVSSGLGRSGRRGSNKAGPSPLSRSDESPDDEDEP